MNFFQFEVVLLIGSNQSSRKIHTVGGMEGLICLKVTIYGHEKLIPFFLQRKNSALRFSFSICVLESLINLKENGPTGILSEFDSIFSVIV